MKVIDEKQFEDLISMNDYYSDINIITPMRTNFFPETIDKLIFVGNRRFKLRNLR